MDDRSRDHVLTGSITLVLRILQFILAVTIVGLAGYGLSFLVFSGISLNMFTAVFTVLFCIYCICASTFLVRLYNYWVILFFDVMGFIFWLTSFALLTSQVRPFFASYYYGYGDCAYYYYGVCYYKRDLDIAGSLLHKRATTNIFTYRNSMAAAAALAGLNWLFFIVTMITTIAYIAKHRKAGGHAMYGHTATNPVTHEPKRGDLESHGAANYANNGVHEPAATHQPTGAEMQSATQHQAPYPST